MRIAFNKLIITKPASQYDMYQHIACKSGLRDGVCVCVNIHTQFILIVCCYLVLK